MWHNKDADTIYNSFFQNLDVSSFEKMLLIYESNSTFRKSENSYLQYHWCSIVVKGLQTYYVNDKDNENKK